MPVHHHIDYHPISTYHLIKGENDSCRGVLLVILGLVQLNKY